MTPRGRPRSRSSVEERYESFQLVSKFKDSLDSEDDLEEDIFPDTDASLLRRHQAGDEEEWAHEDKKSDPGFLQRVIAFMSRSPLIEGSKAARSSTVYGALPNQVPNSSPDVLQTHGSDISDDDVQRRGKRRGKSTAIRPTASFASFGSRRRRDGSASHSRNRFRRASLRSSSPMLIAEPGHPAGQGGHIGGGIPLATSEDEDEDEEVNSTDEDDVLNPPDNSPYPQVRASVAATDDTSASINTPRMWILSLLCALVGSATNLFFSLRYPSVAITPVIALVVVHPLGRLWDRLLKRPDDPAEAFENGTLLRGDKAQSPTHGFSKSTRLRLWLAQGKWNAKEHACVYISSNVSFGFAFATDVIVEQSKFYRQDPSILYQLLLTISTQVLGYSFAGLTRRYLVRPPSMIWPGTLMSTAMFTTMHSSENKSANGWLISRWKFFLLVWSGAFAWYFLPGLLMPALSYFSVITWFAPKNVVIANLVSHLIRASHASANNLSLASRLAWGSFP